MQSRELHPSRPGLLARAPLWAAAAALVALLAPSLAGVAQLVFRDMLQTFWPMKAASWQGVGGALQTWNGAAFAGSSALADVVLQPFYLPNLLFRLLHVPAWPGIAWFLYAHALLALWGAYLLGRRLCGREGAALGAAAFALSGYQIANLTNLQFFCACAWAPWVLLAADRACERPSLRRFTLLVLVAPQVALAGDPRELITLALAAAAVWVLRARAPWRRLWPFALGACAVMLLLLSPTLYATLRALPSFTRNALSLESRSEWAFAPVRLVELWVPRLFGPLFDDGFWGGFTVDHWKRSYLHSFYLGAIFPACLLAALRFRRRAALWLLGGLLGFAWLSMGPRGHLDELFAKVVPTWKLYRYGERIMLLPTLAGALLIALGAEQLLRASAGGGRRLLLLTAAVGLVSLEMVALVFPAGPGPWAEPATRAALYRSALQLCVVLGCAAVALRLQTPSHRAAALGLLLVADLAAANGELTGQLPRALFRSPPQACESVRRAAQGKDPATFRVFVEETALERSPHQLSGAASGLPAWAAQRVEEYAWAKRNLLTLCGYSQSVGLTSLEPLAESQLWRAAGPVRALRALSTRFALVPPESRLALVPGAHLVEQQAAYLLLDLPALPRLYRPLAVRVGTGAQLLAALPREQALLTEEVAVLDTGDEPLREHAADPGAALLRFEDGNDRQRWTLRQGAPGYWAIGDALDADWTAEVDGAPARLVTADLAHRALWLPAGTHEVSLRHRPLIALSLFGASLAASLLLVALALQRMRLQQRELRTGPSPH